MQTAQLTNKLVPRPQKKMIGVGEKNLNAQLFERSLCQALNCRRRPHGHKNGRIYRTMRGGQPSETRATGIRFKNFKWDFHAAILAA